MSDVDEMFAGGVGRPGPEDWANGTAALSAALVREARVLAQTSAALMEATGSETARAAVPRAHFALGASAIIVEISDTKAQAERLKKTAEYYGVSSVLAASVLRAAALALPTDDAAARIAAAMLTQQLAETLGG